MPWSGPVPILEMAEGNGPLDAAPSWHDITKLLISGATKRGRQHELGVFQAGTMSLTMDNRGGEFNPWNTAGPYYGGGAGLQPLRPIRLRVVYNSITYPVWRGYLQKLTPKWNDPTNNELDFECADGFMVFNQGTQRSTAYRDAVIADGATSYWRCGDSAGATAFAEQISNNSASISGTPTLGVAGALLLDADTGFTATASADYASVPAATGVGPSGAGAFTLEGWLRRDSATTYSSLMSNPWAPYPVQWNLWVDTGGVIRWQTVDAGHTFNLVSPTAVNADGAYHHIVLVRAANGFSYTLYLDKVAVATGNDGASAVTIASNGTTILGGVGSNPTGTAGFDEMAIYKGVALSAAQVASHYDKGHPAQVGTQLSGARLASLLDAFGWPAADRAIDAGLSNCQGETQGQVSGSVLSYMQLVELTEMGALFMSADGKVTFHQRDKMFKAPFNASQLTLGPGGEPYELAGTTPTGDDTGLYNDISAQRIGGVLQSARDAASIAAFGERTLSEIGLLNINDNEVFDRVNYRLANLKNYAARVERVDIHPLDDPAVLYPQVFTRDLRDQVLFGRDFIGQGSALSQPSRIEGIEHEFTADGDWHTYWALTPAETTTYWVLGTSVLDTTTRLAA